jgi:hypothetical protein
VNRLVAAALEAIERQDWDRLRLILHPYLHWTAADGVRMRGRVNVQGMLAASPVTEAPSDFEIRDGQIYRWTEPPRSPRE